MPDGHDDIESYWEGLRPPPAVETGMAAAMNQRVGAGGGGSSGGMLTIGGGAIVTGAGVHGWHASPGGGAGGSGIQQGQMVDLSGNAQMDAMRVGLAMLPHEAARAQPLQPMTLEEIYQDWLRLTYAQQLWFEEQMRLERSNFVPRAEIQQRLEVALRDLPPRGSRADPRTDPLENLVNAFAELGMPIVGELTVAEDHRIISISFLNPNVDVDDSGGAVHFTIPLDVSGT